MDVDYKDFIGKYYKGDCEFETMQNGDECVIFSFNEVVEFEAYQTDVDYFEDVEYGEQKQDFNIDDIINYLDIYLEADEFYDFVKKNEKKLAKLAFRKLVENLEY